MSGIAAIDTQHTKRYWAAAQRKPQEATLSSKGAPEA